MQVFLLLWFAFCLFLAICQTSKGVSGDAVKGVMVVGVSILIYYIWIS
jgi:hypothetical protein